MLYMYYTAYTKFIAVGGYDAVTGDSIASVELVDLSGSQRCALADYPAPTNDLTAAFVAGAVRACGGYSMGVGNSGGCYMYDNATNAWSSMGTMSVPR